LVRGFPLTLVEVVVAWRHGHAAARGDTTALLRGETAARLRGDTVAHGRAAAR
jgi:hypothetical protein